ncbi:unnamed protein product, partial [Brenthis ino]
MNIGLCFMLLLNTVYITEGSTVRNVRLVDHTSYALEVIKETVKRIEDQQWSSLKLGDIIIPVNQTILGRPIIGDVEFTNGFVVSIHGIDIIQHTVQQVWLPATVNTTYVEVRATMRMFDVAIGFDVSSKMNIGNYRSTVLILYPEMQFRFTIVKDLFTDELTTTVFGVIMRSHSQLEFVPEDEITKVVPFLFNWNSTGESVNKWDSRACLVNRNDYFMKIIQKTVTKVETDVQWSNLKLLDLNRVINKHLFKWHAQGTVNYTNGFVVAIQKIDVSNLQDGFSSRNVNGTVENLASARGLLHFRNMKIGYDVNVNLEDSGSQRFTGLYMYNVVSTQYSKIFSTTQFNDKKVPYDFLRPWLSDGLLISNGNKWHRRRKMLTPVFHINLLKKFVDTFVHHTEDLLEIIEEKGLGTKINLHALITHASFRIMCETLTGVSKQNSSGLAIDKYFKAIQIFGECAVERLCRVWYFFDFTFNLSKIGQTQKKVVEDIHVLTKNIIDNRRKALLDNRPEKCSNLSKYKSRANLILLDLLLEKEADMEIDEKGGYTIPRNTHANIMVYDLHHREDIYPQAEKFIPERFLPENSMQRHHFAFIPFSAGPRNCIGQKFAMLELKIVLSGILRRYRLEPVTKPDDLVFISDLVLRTKDPIYVRFLKRS